jgi:anaerobic selenocysteine-containing dehydrogenase
MPSETLHSACPLDCPDLCSLEVEVEDGRVKRVDGGTRTPITDGFICGKVRNIADHLYGEHRVTTPLIREGGKPDGVFRAASWDEALGVIESRMRAIIARSGPQAVLPYHYGGSNGWLTEGALATRFFRRLGASNLDRTLCAAATTAATRGLYGVMPGVALEDYVDAKLIVMWGMNPSATGIHHVPIVERARERGAKLVVIDPRRIPLARRADLHLAVRPGTDLVVALAVIHALFERGLADERFLAQHATGVDELRARAAKWPLDAAARESGVPVADLERFVELYASSSPAVVRCGWGPERNRNGGSAIAAILALPAVAGKFGVHAGGYTMSNGDATWGVDAAAAIATPPTASRTINMSQLARAIDETRDPRIEALFVYNANPAATTPNQTGVRAALARDDLFVVVHEQVMTDTARLADVVLPATAFLEHRDVRRGYGAMRMYDSKPVATAPGLAWNNNQLFGALLRRFELVRPADPMSDDELVERIFASSPHGAGLRAQLTERGVATPISGEHPVAFVDVFPSTPDRKVHLVPEALDREAGGLYVYKPDPGTHRFPLALISPALATQISSTFGQLRTKEVPLEIGPDDAAARGIADGDAVRVHNDLGEVVCAAKISPDLRPGVVLLPKGMWSHHSRNGFTSNALIPETLADLAGQAAYNDARVEVEKL